MTQLRAISVARITFLALILFLAATFAAAQTNARPAGRHPAPGNEDVLRAFRIASFTGSFRDSIQATATDSSGNIYVAGTTFSSQFPVKNAGQPVFGDASILRTTDLGKTWTPVGGPPGGATALVVDPITEQVMFATAPNGIHKSTDSGKTWKQIYPLSGSSPLNVPVFGPLAIDPGNHLHLAAFTPAGTLIRSLDGGATWVTTSAVCTSFNECQGQLMADPTGSGTLLLVTIGGILISRDWGATFVGIGPATAVAFDPSHPGWIYLDISAGVTGSLYLSTNYGSPILTLKGSPQSTFSSIHSLAVDPDQPNILLASTGVALYKSTDGAESWTLETPPGGFVPSESTPLLLVPGRCGASGGVFALGTGGVSFSPDFGITWPTERLTGVSSVVAGPNCTYYVTRNLSSDASDAFLAKIAPDGHTLWATFLGGSDQDAAVALALDSQGNVYVAGNTASPDFPTTAPHIGPQGQNSVFLTRFSTEGAILSSVTLGGEAASTAIALAIDQNQNAFIAGNTNSQKFPVTPGALATKLDQASYTGFLARLASDGTLSSATYLGNSYTEPGAIFVNKNEDMIIGGTGVVPGTTSPVNGATPVFVMKVDSAGSKVLQYTYLPSGAMTISGLAADSQANLVVFGEMQYGASGLQPSPGAYSSPQSVSCTDTFPPIVNGTGYVMKLSAPTWQPVYTATLNASCGINTGSMVLDSTGAPVIAMGASSGLLLKYPLVAGPGACPSEPPAFSSAIAKLSADGSTLQFATYLNNCGVPGIALAADGSIYAGVAPLETGNATSVLHLETSNSAAISIDQISNAFSGDPSTVTFGGLYALTISGLEVTATNLGLKPSQDLPTKLNGVEVTFDGIAAPILATAPGQVIVAAPPIVTRGGQFVSSGYASVQVVHNGAASNRVAMPVSPMSPGLLTVDFPNAPPPDGADAYALNADGTQNDANHPAAAGSTVTLFVTGMGETNPFAAPGTIATSTEVMPVTPVYTEGEYAGLDNEATPLVVTSIPGFLFSVFQVQIPDIQTKSGTSVGNGVMRVEVGLTLHATVFGIDVPASNFVSIYVK